MSKANFLNAITDFWKGVIVGFVIALIIMSLILALVISHYRNKEMKEYAERVQAVEALRQEYNSRDSVEFLDDADVRGAVDGAVGEFERKRDKLLHGFRNRITD